MTFYSRNLPHWHPEEACIFLTWRLYGTLPGGTVTPDCASASQSTKPSSETRMKKVRRLEGRLSDSICSLTGRKTALGGWWIPELQGASRKGWFAVSKPQRNIVCMR